MTTMQLPGGATRAGPAPRAPGAEPTRRSAWLALLRMPLVGKLAGANVLVAAIAAVALVLIHRDGAEGDVLLAYAIVALAVGVFASLALIKVALEPVARLRTTLRRFAQGDGGIRVRPSLVADRDLAGVGDAVNDLLDDLLAERARVRGLARDTIRGADEERARIARGLHDSTAQTLAALSLEARMALDLQASRELTQQLELIRDLAVEAVEEVRELSHTIHPRVLDDLGLPAALGWLARGVRDSAGLEAELRFSGDAHRIPSDVACSLFRVAEAALAAASAGGARSGEIRLDVSPEHVALDIRDDAVAPHAPSTRLLTLGERLTLSGGTLTIRDQDGRGLHVHAVVPLGPEAGKELP